MKLKYVFIANAVISLGFGGSLVLASSQLASLFGVNVELTQAGIALNRLFGAAIVGYGLLTWLARNTADSEARRAIVLALFVTHAIGFILAVLAQLAGMASALGWLIVAMYLLLALGYGYFQFAKPGAS